MLSCAVCHRCAAALQHATSQVAARAAELKENLDVILNALLYQPDKVLWCACGMRQVSSQALVTAR